MRAMILAAGQGKRLRPLTEKIPKPMVPVGGQSLISWHIDKLKAVGVTDLVVNGAYLQDVLFEYLGDGSKFGVKIAQSPEDADGLETAGGIINALPLLGDKPFLVVNGDVFYDGDYAKFLKCPLEADITDEEASCKVVAHLFLVKNPAHNLKGDYALSKDGFLEYGSDYTFSGIAWYHPKAFLNKEVAREPLRPYFDKWVQNGQITASLLDGNWFDVGTVERLNEIESYLKAKA